MTEPQHSSSLRRAYRLTRYHAGGVVVRIGQTLLPSDSLRFHSGRKSSRSVIALIGAANPGGRRKPDGWNGRMTLRLIQYLARPAGAACIIPGEGCLGQWREPLVAAEIPLARAVMVARRFRQNAIVVVIGSRPAKLVWLR